MATQIKWDTIDDVRQTVGVIHTPFATDPSATTEFEDEGDSESYDSTDVTYQHGFPEAFVKPIIKDNGDLDDSARVITRKMMNTLGNLGTQEQFFSQCGGYYTFDPEVCTAIGGYPKSAVLRYYDEATNTLRTVYSLQDHNPWNFLTDGVDGSHWMYIDDNPSLSLNIDYSDFIDLSSNLFVETGLADFYEVPFDAWLNLFSFSFCMMQSTAHNSSEDVKALYKIETNEVDGKAVTTRYFDYLNAGLFTSLTGTTYLDIHNDKTNTTRSLVLRNEGSMSYGASLWTEALNGDYGMRYFYKQPRYVVGQGTCFLNKGDKIRVRGVYVDALGSTDDYVNFKLPFANISAIHSMTLTDVEVQRYYLCKFANLYKVGWGA